MGSCECTLAEVVAHRRGQARFERALMPYARRPGDCGVIYIYSEEQTQIKDVITFQFSGSNLDKCDVFSESDPFFVVNKTNPDGSDTLVYRSDYIKVSPSFWPPFFSTFPREITNSIYVVGNDIMKPMKF